MSYRSSPELDTIGCAWGEDTIAWLRREMATTTPRSLPPARGMKGRIVRHPVAPAPRPAEGTALAVVAAAVGLGLLLSALNRRPPQTPLPGAVIRH